MIINSPNGPTSNPAKAIIDQFYKALQEVNEPNKQAWAILLNQYGPSVITQCENYIKMSENLIRDWLNRFMFKTEAPDVKAPIIENIASFWLITITLKVMVAIYPVKKQNQKG